MDERDLEVAERAVEQTTAAAVARSRAAVSGVSNGTCCDCGERIEAARLAVAPFAARCLTCQQASERGRAAA